MKVTRTTARHQRRIARIESILRRNLPSWLRGILERSALRSLTRIVDICRRKQEAAAR